MTPPRTAELTAKARIVAERIGRMRRALRSATTEPERALIRANLAHAAEALKIFNRARKGRSLE